MGVFANFGDGFLSLKSMVDAAETTCPFKTLIDLPPNSSGCHRHHKDDYIRVLCTTRITFLVGNPYKYLHLPLSLHGVQKIQDKPSKNSHEDCDLARRCGEENLLFA